MAILKREGGGRTVPLPVTALVGRSRRAEIRLDGRQVSNIHASLRWTGRAWEVRDHSSRNGTRLNGAHLTPGAPRGVKRGATVEFGSKSERWILEDDGPPVPFAVGGDGQLVVGADSLLALPSNDMPEVTVFQAASAAWMLEDRHESRVIEDRAQITTAATTWTLHLPAPMERTAAANASAIGDGMDDVQLRFRVSSNEEEVEIRIVDGARVKVLNSRAHSYLLLILARQRLEDAKSLPTTDCGWIHRDRLARMLRMDPSHLHVSVFRARRQFAVAGVAGAAGLIEWRQGSGKLRIGCSNLLVERA